MVFNWKIIESTIIIFTNSQMRSLFATALAGAVTASTEVESAFMAYIVQFNKSYSTVDEYGFRLSHFARNHANIIEHNASDSSFALGHN